MHGRYLQFRYLKWPLVDKNQTTHWNDFATTQLWQVSKTRVGEARRVRWRQDSLQKELGWFASKKKEAMVLPIDS